MFLGLVKIINGDLKYIELGNIYAKRDWGYAKEYVEAMWKMLQQKNQKIMLYLLAKHYSIKYFINLATNYLN